MHACIYGLTLVVFAAGKIAQLQGLVAQLQSSNAELTRDKDIAASDSKQVT